MNGEEVAGGPWLSPEISGGLLAAAVLRDREREEQIRVARLEVAEKRRPQRVVLELEPSAIWSFKYPINEKNSNFTLSPSRKEFSTIICLKDRTHVHAHYVLIIPKSS